jgi:sec-independent protein translocase protein TatA
MGGLSIWHIVILAGVAILLFGGRGKISDLMGDVAKGVRSFREGLADPNEAKTINTQATPAPQPAPNKDQTPVG